MKDYTASLNDAVPLLQRLRRFNDSSLSGGGDSLQILKNLNRYPPLVTNGHGKLTWQHETTWNGVVGEETRTEEEA